MNAKEEQILNKKIVSALSNYNREDETLQM